MEMQNQNQGKGERDSDIQAETAHAVISSKESDDVISVKFTRRVMGRGGVPC
jgi:hypothetical protein